MSYLELLPDKWWEMSEYRSKKYKNESLQMLRSRKAVFDMCDGCPGFRMRVIAVYGYEYVITSCLFVNKCIKQYPHRVDKKEFK